MIMKRFFRPMLCAVALWLTSLAYGQTITKAEYFLDVDPGIGEGTAVSMTPSAAIDQNFSLNTTGLSAGLHRLYLRAQQSDGLWSIPKTRFFYVSDNNNTEIIRFATDIVAAEYFYDEDPGVGKGARIPLQKSSSIDKNWIAKTDGLAEGDHYLYIRTQSQDGLWGVPDTLAVNINGTVCQVPAVGFEFDIVDINTNIGITDLSTNVDAAATYSWDVNDDGTEESTSPTFDTQFAARGIYPIRLTITNPDGCAASILKEVFVTSDINSALTLSANDSLIVGNELNISAPAGYTYEWSTGQTTQSITVSEAGDYYAFLSADGITFKSEVVNVETFDALTADFSSFDATSGLTNGAATIENIDSDGLPYTISWSTGLSEVRSLTGLAPGNYSATITTPLDTYNFPFTIGNVTPVSSSIVQAEYFIETDPGIGNGTPIDIYQAETLNIGFNVDASALSTGLYKLYTRVKQASGLWSIPKYSHFYVIDPNARVYEAIDRNLIGAEYFFDKDPGIGNGTSVTVSSTKIADINFGHTISTLSSGLHDLYIRTQQDDGMWSLADRVTFFVIGGRFEEVIEFKTDIVEAEYFFDTDPGVGKGKALPIQKTAQVDSRPWAASTQGLAQGDHTLNIRAKNQDGIWNTVSSQLITVNDKACIPPLADFAFDTVGVETLVGLTDLTTGLSDSVTYAWDVFGDGTIESTRFDFDTTFSANGIYPIKLTVVNFPDSCFTSVVKDIVITDGLTATITANKLDSLLVGDSITFTAPAGYAYEWNNGDSTQSITVGQSGTYYAWLEADGINFKSQAKSVAFFEEITANISVNGASAGVLNGSAAVSNIFTDGLPYNIIWTNGETNETQVNQLAPGNYQVEVNTILDTITFTFNIGEITLTGSEILKSEYFFGADPGPGNGTEIVTYQADQVSFEFTPDISSLDVGLQRLYIRAQQADGIWGIPKVRFFYVIDPNARAYVPIDNNLIAAEYFIDSDPGIGSGTAVTVAEAKTADQNFPLLAGNINPGLHTIYIRAQQTDGVWSIPSKTKFFVIDTLTNDVVVFNTDIVAAEYYFDDDPGIGQGFSLPVQKTDSLTSRPWSATTTGLKIGKHVLNLRAQNQDGLWNAITSTDVFVYPSDCDLPNANFSFDTVGINTPVGLTDLSTNVLADATYQWDINGDESYESTDPAFNPSFESNGVFPLRLTVSNTSGCSTSITKDILVVDGLPSALSLNANDSLLVGDTLRITAPTGYAYEWSNGKKSQEIAVTESGNYYAYLTKDSINFKSEVIAVNFFNPITASVASYDATNGNNGAARIDNLSHDDLPISITWSNGLLNAQGISDLAAGSYSVTLATPIETVTFNFDILTSTPAANSLTALEYFLDTDPGPGLGTAIPIYENPSVEIARPVVMSNVSEGAHTVYFRAKKDDGLWGFSVPKKFYIIPVDGGLVDLAFGGDIVYAEYAFDNLPDPGLGTAIGITPALSLEESLAVDISTLNAGDHTLFIQLRDASGNWSFAEAEPFVICTNTPPAPTVPDVTECFGSDLIINITALAGNTINVFDSAFQLMTSQTAFTYIFTDIEETQIIYVSQTSPDGCESARTPVNLNVNNVQAFAGPDTRLPVARVNIQLDDNFPKGGAWSGSPFVTAEGLFSPSSAGLGDYTLSYTLDSAGCTLTDQMVVMVREITDGIPEVSNQVFAIDENVVAGSLIGTIAANDIDSDILKYFGATPTDTLYVSIDSLSGELFVKDSTFFDFETTDSLGINIIVADEYAEVSAEISILIRDINEAPILADQSYTIFENVIDGFVLDTLKASDDDLDPVTYVILSGNELGAFTLTSGGALLVADSSLIDFESTPAFNLAVQISDGVLTNDLSIQIDVTNVNEGPGLTGKLLSLNENSPTGTVVTELLGIDPENDPLTYSILSGNDLGAFAINGNQLTVAEQTMLDFETTPEFTLIVEVSDRFLMDTASYSINLIDMNESISIADSTLLANIYVSTNGDNWTNNEGWNTAPIAQWYGVVVDGLKMVKVNMSNNNLVGTVDADFIQISALDTLNLSNNRLSDVPALDKIAGISSIDISQNLLSFGVIEEFANLDGVKYAPQKSLLEELSILAQLGEDVTIDRTIPGQELTYGWFKDGQPFEGTGSSITINAASFAAEGIFSASVTSAIIPGLTITTKDVVFKVSSLERDITALQVIYNTANGPSWTDVQNWNTMTTDNMASFAPEVTLSNSRVVGLDLSGKNVSGAIPTAINDIAGLTTIDLSENQIADLPKMTQLQNLTNINVAANLLDFGDLEQNTGLPGLVYSPQANITNVPSISIPEGDDYNIQITTGGTQNSYEWRLTNDVFDDIALTADNASSYSITAIDYETMGYYELVVTNEQLPQLTLRTDLIEILATANVSGVITGENDQPLPRGGIAALKIGAANQPFDKVDSVSVTSGVFAIPELVLGDYIFITNSDILNSEGERLYLPTYYQGTDLWTEADTLLLRADNVINEYGMAFLPPPPVEGEGKVFGSVEADLGDAGGRILERRKVKKAGCSVRRFRASGRDISIQEGTFELFAYVETNDNGEFEFLFLPAGLYRFNIEFPGIPMDPDSFVEFEIGGNGFDANNFKLEAFITEEGIEVTRVEALALYEQYFRDLDVYPVPAKDYINIKYDRLLADEVEVKLIDLVGKTIASQKLATGWNQQYQLDVSEIPDGFYLLHFKDPKESMIVSYKILIRH
jgi:hypothetical protein